jgi:hypothetical protein
MNIHCHWHVTHAANHLQSMVYPPTVPRAHSLTHSPTHSLTHPNTCTSNLVLCCTRNNNTTRTRQSGWSWAADYSGLGNLGGRGQNCDATKLHFYANSPLVARLQYTMQGSGCARIVYSDCETSPVHPTPRHPPLRCTCLAVLS